MLRVSKSLQRFFIKQALPRDQKDLLRDIGIISALPVTGTAAGAGIGALINAIRGKSILRGLGVGAGTGLGAGLGGLGGIAGAALTKGGFEQILEMGIGAGAPVGGGLGYYLSQLLAGPEKDDLVPTPDDVVLSEKLEKLRKSLKG